MASFVCGRCGTTSGIAGIFDLRKEPFTRCEQCGARHRVEFRGESGMSVTGRVPERESRDRDTRERDGNGEGRRVRPSREGPGGPGS